MSKTFDEFRYTICPVGNATFVAANVDRFIPSAFRRLGVTPTLLQSLPHDRWHVHFDQQDDALFREGGNIPPLWARSRGADVILIGLAPLEQRSYVLVRPDSGIDSVEQLRGRRLAVPTNPNASIDFYRATVQHGLETALAARGVAPDEVSFVDVDATEPFPATDPAHRTSLGDADAKALLDGQVDAIYAGSLGALRLLATGDYKPLYELSADPAQVAPINNVYPNALTVSRPLAEERPDVVVEFLRQVILAARWAQDHYDEVLTLFARQLNGTRGEVASALPIGFNRRLEPSLSAGRLALLEGQKHFLLTHGYLERDFDLADFADDSFLRKAQASIDAE